MRLSLETINYQYKDTFPKDLELLVEGIYSQIDKKDYKNIASLTEKSTYIKKIEKLIFERIKLNVVFSKNLHVISPAAIIPFFGDYFRNANEPKGFIYGTNFRKVVREIEDIHKEKKTMMNKIHGRKGTVNNKMARVGGYLSEVRHFIILDFFTLKAYGLTASETTAVILHELGHAYDGLEDHNKLESTNRAILDVLNDIHQKKPDEIQYEFSNKFSKKEFMEAAMSDSEVQKDFCAELAMDYLQTVKTQMIHGKYDETSFENMADSFAARFGMGKEIITGLDKLNRMSGQTYQDSRALYVIYYTIQVMLYASLFLFIPVVGVIAYTVVMAYLFKSDQGVMTYDFPIERYNRVKNTIVNGMKRLDLPKEVLEDLLEQFYTITSIIDQTAQLKSLSTIIGDHLFASSRESAYYIDLQQKIENILNNNLFVKSAQLRVI